MERRGDAFAYRAGAFVGSVITKLLLLITDHPIFFLLGAATVFLTGTACMFATIDDGGQARLQSLFARSWGGFDERPMTDKCYKQERTAMILALLFGTLGADQWYARHWALAAFKTVTLGGAGLWSFIDVILWMVGGIYGTPDCPGGSPNGWAY